MTKRPSTPEPAHVAHTGAPRPPLAPNYHPAPNRPPAAIVGPRFQATL